MSYSLFDARQCPLPPSQSPFQACRYHSLVIKKETIPEDLEITAWTEDGNIMGVRHKKYPHVQVCVKSKLFCQKFHFILFAATGISLL